MEYPEMTVLNKGEYTGDIVRSHQMEGCTITNTVYAAKKNNPEWHYHENLHICFVFEGGKSQTKHQTRYSKKEGSIFFYRAEEQHRWISPAPIAKSANIEIEDSFLKEYDLKQEDIKKAVHSNINAKALILKMQHELLQQHEGEYLSKLLLELVSYQNEKNHASLPRWAELLMELLHDQWNESLSLQEIATHVGAHPVTISKNFRKYFQCTLGEYQRKLKIDKSIDLIKNTDLSLSEIAFYCGFTDQSHFIRNFKQQTHFLPKGYRRF